LPHEQISRNNKSHVNFNPPTIILGSLNLTTPHMEGFIFLKVHLLSEAEEGDLVGKFI
jgi:hypothetical protein